MCIRLRTTSGMTIVRKHKRKFGEYESNLESPFIPSFLFEMKAPTSILFKYTYLSIELQKHKIYTARFCDGKYMAFCATENVMHVSIL